MRTSEVDNFVVDVEKYLSNELYIAETKEKLGVSILEVAEELKIAGSELDCMNRAAAILGNVADDRTKAILDNITGAINRTLGDLFKDDKRSIEIKQVMYRNTYPHFVVELETEQGIKRTFKQSGVGLAQVVSFLFVVCLIGAREARRVIVMDELLNGLHPDAKKIIKALIEFLSDKFQFVIVEYGVDVGKQYEVVKNKSIATVTEYDGNYYEDLQGAD